MQKNTKWAKTNTLAKFASFSKNNTSAISYETFKKCTSLKILFF